MCLIHRVGDDDHPLTATQDLSMSSRPTDSSSGQKTQIRHWVGSLRIVLFILSLWLVISLGCGVLFRDWLDEVMPNVGGAPFGFWMAQQGAILGFLVLLLLYMVMMNALDRANGFDGERE